MSKAVQVGFVCPVPREDWDTELDKYKIKATRGFALTAMRYRLILPPVENVRLYQIPPDISDPLGYEYGSVGYKSYSVRHPWYKGWLSMFWAFMMLRGLSNA